MWVSNGKISVINITNERISERKKIKIKNKIKIKAKREYNERIHQHLFVVLISDHGMMRQRQTYKNAIFGIFFLCNGSRNFCPKIQMFTLLLQIKIFDKKLLKLSKNIPVQNIIKPFLSEVKLVYIFYIMGLLLFRDPKIKGCGKNGSRSNLG